MKLTLPQISYRYSLTGKKEQRQILKPVVCLVLYGLQPARLLCPWDSPGKNTGVGCYALLQGIFPTQGSNPHFLCLLHYRQILYLMSHQGSPLYLHIACRAWFLPAQEHQLSQKWLWRHMTQTPARPSGQLRASSPSDCVGADLYKWVLGTQPRSGHTSVSEEEKRPSVVRCLPPSWPQQEYLLPNLFW